MTRRYNGALRLRASMSTPAASTCARRTRRRRVTGRPYTGGPRWTSNAHLERNRSEPAREQAACSDGDDASSGRCKEMRADVVAVSGDAKVAIADIPIRTGRSPAGHRRARVDDESRRPCGASACGPPERNADTRRHLVRADPLPRRCRRCRDSPSLRPVDVQRTPRPDFRSPSCRRASDDPRDVLWSPASGAGGVLLGRC